MSLTNFSQHVCLPQHLRIFQSLLHHIYHEHAAEYWLMAQEYDIWNAAIESLQFWAEDLDPITLGIASEHVSTPTSSGPHPVTPCISYLMKYCLDVSSLH